MKIVGLLLLGLGVVRINAQDSDVDDESYSVQMDHKEMHSTPIEGTFLFSRALDVVRNRHTYRITENYIVPNYVPTEAEKEEMLKVKPTMVEEGHFERILCEAYENCTDATPIDENAKPDEVGDGQIEKERSHELRQRMREALLMRWDTVETNLLTDVQK